MRTGIPVFLRSATRNAPRLHHQRRISQLRFVSTRETARLQAVPACASVLSTRVSASTAYTHAQTLALLSLATLVSGSIALAAPLKKMESADAVKAEELYNDNAYDRRALLATLREMHAANPEDVGVIWRLTRAAYDVSNLKSTSAEEKKELTYYAKDVIQKGIDLTKDVAQVHNWFGIILSSIGDYEGSKVAIANSYTIKGHWEKSIELDPTNSTTYYLLGRWCISISDLSWLERKAAAVLFGTPPQSSYDEALGFLMKSENLAPGSWKKNTFLIAQVYYKMKNWAASKEWTEKALAVPVKTEEDQTIHDEAAALLKKF